MTKHDNVASLLANLVRDRPGDHALQATAYTAGQGAKAARVRTHCLKTLAKDPDLNPEVRAVLLTDRNVTVRAAVWRYQPWSDDELRAEVQRTRQSPVLSAIVRRSTLSESVARLIFAKVRDASGTGPRDPLWAALRNGNLPAAVAPDFFAACLPEFAANSHTRRVSDTFGLLERADVALAVGLDDRCPIEARAFAAGALVADAALPVVKSLTSLVESAPATDPRLRLNTPETHRLHGSLWKSLLQVTDERWRASAQVHQAVGDLLSALVQVAPDLAVDLAGVETGHSDAAEHLPHPEGLDVLRALGRADTSKLERILASCGPGMSQQSIVDQVLRSELLSQEHLAVVERVIPEALADDHVAALMGSTLWQLPPSPALAIRWPEPWARAVLKYLAGGGSLAKVTSPGSEHGRELAGDLFVAAPHEWTDFQIARIVCSGLLSTEQAGWVPSDILLTGRNMTADYPAEVAEALSAAFGVLGDVPPGRRGTALTALIELTDQSTPLKDLAHAVSAAS